MHFVIHSSGSVIDLLFWREIYWRQTIAQLVEALMWLLCLARLGWVVLERASGRRGWPVLDLHIDCFSIPYEHGSRCTIKAQVWDMNWITHFFTFLNVVLYIFICFLHLREMLDQSFFLFILVYFNATEYSWPKILLHNIFIKKINRSTSFCLNYIIIPTLECVIWTA